MQSQVPFVGKLEHLQFIGLLRGVGSKGRGFPKIFPKVPQSSLGILRVPQLPPPLRNPTINVHPPSLTARPPEELPGPTFREDRLAVPSFFQGRAVKLPVEQNQKILEHLGGKTW